MVRTATQGQQSKSVISCAAALLLGRICVNGASLSDRIGYASYVVGLWCGVFGNGSVISSQTLVLNRWV
jgi:hypothetical protein